jgi:hypothetical protein
MPDKKSKRGTCLTSNDNNGTITTTCEESATTPPLHGMTQKQHGSLATPKEESNSGHDIMRMVTELLTRETLLQLHIFTCEYKCLNTTTM